MEDIVDEIKLDINLWDLIQAFKGVLDRGGEELARTIERENVSIEEKMDEILAQLDTQEGIFFKDLFSGEQARLIVVVTFIALLELIRQRLIGIQQSKTLGDIWLVKQAS